MNRLQRYVLKEMLGPTFVGLLAYGLVLLMNLSLEAAEMAIRRDLPTGLVLRFIILSLPRIVVLTLPMAVLVGVLVGIGRLAADGEIAALKALGYDVRRLVVAAAALGIGTATITWLVFDLAVPTTNYAQHQLQAEIFISSDLNREIQPRAFYEKIPDLLIYADSANPADGTLEQVLLYQKATDGTEEISTAARARIEYLEGRGDLSFHLEDVISHEWDRAHPEGYQLAHRAEESIVRPPDVFTTEMLRSLKDPPPPNLREQDVAQIRKTIEEFRHMPKGPGRKRVLNEALVELHKKFSIPATCFVFALLGLPISLAQRRGGKAWGFLVSLVVIAIQYFLLTAGEQMADRGRVSPAVAMWAGNAIFGAAALLMLATGGRWSWDPTALAERWRGRRYRGDRAPKPAAAPAASQGPESIRPGRTEPRRTGLLRWLPAIDVYLLRTLLAVTGLVGLSLTLLFALFLVIDVLDDLTKNNQPASMLVSYVANALPNSIALYVLPVGLCAATLITFALLSRTHELTAIRGSGIGPYRVSSVFILFAGTIAALSFGALDSVLPATNQRAIQIKDQIRNRSPRSYRQPEKRWIFGSRGDLVTFSNFNRDRNEILDLGILRFQPKTFFVRERFFAERAGWSAGGWVLQNGWRRDFSGAEETFEPFARLRLEDVDPPAYFAQEWKAPDQMSYGELSAYVADMERRGYETLDLRVGLYRKTAIPAVCVVMVLIALAFAIRTDPRRGPLFGLGISLLLATVYFFAMQTCGKLGEIGVLPPFLAAWAPNLGFSGVGLYLMASSRW
ncbi:MAG: LptF/LptG family permease [Acidobacteria bacterium]|nr:LptF/LptG family permease [Acidobacteriota bacterium]